MGRLALRGVVTIYLNGGEDVAQVRTFVYNESVEKKEKEVKRLEYVCLDCGGFFEGDEIRRSQNRCESCEGSKSTEEQGDSHAQRGL